MRPLIVADLVNKGYVEQTGDGKPDFLVRLASGYMKELRTSGNEQGGAVPPPGSIETGEIVMDAFDASSDTQVWHGSAEAEVNPERIDDQLLQTGVRQMMATFPMSGMDIAQPGTANTQGH
jgi:hypothetical protein